MRLATKGRLAVAAMLDLAMQRSKHPVTLASISGRQNISLSYLEQLFAKLRRHRLVDSVRGPGGGYTAARDLGSISVAEIISAVEEPLDAAQRGGKENRDNERKCTTHDLWAKLNRQVLDYLGAVTLKQLVEEQQTRQSGVAPATEMREASADALAHHGISLRHQAKGSRQVTSDASSHLGGMED